MPAFVFINKIEYTYVCKPQMFLHWLQDIDVASARQKSILQENEGPYALVDVTTDKDQRVNICTYVRTYNVSHNYVLAYTRTYVHMPCSYTKHDSVLSPANVKTMV